MREALQTEKGPLFIATTGATDLDEVATRSYRSAPNDVARLGFAVANQLDPNAPAAKNLPKDVQEFAETIAAASAGCRTSTDRVGRGLRMRRHPESGGKRRPCVACDQ